MLRIFTYTIVGLLLCPIALIVVSAFSTTQYMVFPPEGFTLAWFADAAGSAEYRAAFRYSLIVATVTTVISTVVGCLVALALVRYEFPGRAAINGLILSPFVLPHLVIGVALLQWFSALGVAIGTASLVLAHVIISTPYAVRLIAASLTGIDRSLELAAQGLGASPFTVFRRITLPLIGTGVLGAAILSFIVSFDNVTVSIFLSSPHNTTLPVRMYSRVEQGFGSTLAAVSALLVGLAVVLIVVVERAVSLRALFMDRKG